MPTPKTQFISRPFKFGPERYRIIEDLNGNVNVRCVFGKETDRYDQMRTKHANKLALAILAGEKLKITTKGIWSWSSRRTKVDYVPGLLLHVGCTEVSDRKKVRLIERMVKRNLAVKEDA